MDSRANGAGSESEKSALARELFTWRHRPADDALKLASISPLDARQLYNSAGAAFSKMFY
jgi:hypothetical protein